jgi:CheY-like chemotaxis protein
MSSHDLRGLHVFVLEGDHESREVLRTALENCGAFVTTPASVERAKALLRAVRPDVLVTDIAMPVLSIVHELGVRPPMIALTRRERGREALLAEGFADVVEKPLDPAHLCALVQRHALGAQGAPI